MVLVKQIDKLHPVVERDTLTHSVQMLVDRCMFCTSVSSEVRTSAMAPATRLKCREHVEHDLGCGEHTEHDSG